MTAATPCRERLEHYLRDNQVPFEAQHHALAITAQATAETEHVPGQRVVKTVMASVDGKLAMLVVPASHLVQLSAVKTALGARSVYLAEEQEFAATFADCDVGAMPPFGNLYGVAVYVDPSVADNESIVFRAGTHTDTMSVAYADFARLVQPTVASIARHR